MYLSVAMPRATNTSLFTSHVTQGLFILVCLIGLVFIFLIFGQNYRNWKERRSKAYPDEKSQLEAVKDADHDFIGSVFISIVIFVIFVLLGLMMGINWFS
ncbi:hypothetical protein [Lactovum odontotermitis]